jgi:DNA-binding NarL/FixJ family response regulator
MFMSDTQVGEKPKTMLILKSQATALGSVEAYLKNRGWMIHSTANLKEALAYIVTKKPSYVAISIDHPNRKVRALPKIISQALPCAMIVFAESSSSSSYKSLNDMGIDYRVYPPVTGPAFERCVNKYLKDQQTSDAVNVQNEKIKRESNYESNDNFSIKVKHHESQTVKTTVTSGSGSSSGSDPDDESTRQLLSQFLRTGDSDTSSSSTNSSSSAGAKAKQSNEEIIFARTVDEDEGKDTYGYISQDKSDKKDGNQIIASSPDDDVDYNSSQKGATKNGQNYVDSNESSNKVPSAIQENSIGQMNQATQKGPDAGAKGNIGSAHNGESSRQNRQPKPGWSPIGSETMIHHIQSPKTANDKGETLIVRGTETAIKEAIVVKDGPVTELIEESTSAACIVVESDRFSGYLVAVMAGSRKIDQKFIETIKHRLFKFLRDNGEGLADNNALDIRVKQVAFEPWAVQYADFLRKSVHEGNEVAMAFFPRPEVKTKIEESHDKEMAKIALKDLEGDRRVEFDLYVYLPSNNKMVLYTPKGGVFYNKQLVKLKKQGVTHMHIPKTAAEDMSKYRAQNYLNDLVEDFEKKQEEDPEKKKAS